MTPALSVVIPTWNGRALLAECLESLARQTLRDFETVVVDDGSTDGTAAWLRAAYPDAACIVLPENRGFCAAVNAGIEAARAELVFLLNNDMTLEPGALERLVAAAADSPAALFAPLVLWRGEPDRVYGAGDRMLTNGRPESIGFRQRRAEFTPPERIFGVSGGAGLYRRAVFETVGLFDARFVAYFEDADLSFRARLAGFEAAFVPEATAYHVGSASIAGRTWWRSRQCFRNHTLLVLKNMPALLLLRHGPAIFAERVNQLRRAFSSARTEFGAVGAAWTVAGACVSLAAALPHAFRQRWRIQRRRVMPASDVDALLDAPTRDGEG